MIVTLRLATGNPGKARELTRLLGCLVLPIEDWEPPIEDADTFLGNALIKAQAGARVCPGEWVIADDSGIEVAALAGAPGTQSARFGGDGLSDAERCSALLRAVEGSGDRFARFRCVLVALGPQGEEIIAEGVLEGALAEEARGSGGFGYDPILIPTGETRSCGELSPQEKDAISHRGAAVRQLRDALGL